MKTWTSIRLEEGKVLATLFVQEDYTDSDGVVHSVTESEDVSAIVVVNFNPDPIAAKVDKRMKLAMARHMVAMSDRTNKKGLSVKKS